ncbi:MAG: cation transporter [Bacteroidetes bacterium]|nr:cation transporter [Bacteroidota bacterium]
MTHSYQVTGMTCSSCEAKVRDLLKKVPGVKHVSVDLKSKRATIDMDKHITATTLKKALAGYPAYQLSPLEVEHQEIIVEEEKKSWAKTYKPVILVFAYILIVTLLIETSSGSFNWVTWMNYFMTGFFLVFSFFKLLNVKGFAESYATYDIVAKKWMGWGYVYVFIELALGISFLVGFRPFLINAITFVVMTVSIIGVLQSVLNKRKIKCACLGDVFNLPMSTITIIEDGLMIAMSAFMIFRMI